MTTWLKIVFVMLLSTQLNLVQAHEITPAGDHITVTGVGNIEQEPDQAILRISINAQKPTLVAAKQQADEQYQSVLNVIAKAGIEKKHIKAARISAQPQYEWTNNQRVYKGERVSRTLVITINELGQVSPLMQALVNNGVSTIDGLTTGFQDHDAIKQKALAAAADNAKTKAQFLAERLDRNLGTAFQVTEQHQDISHYPQANMRMRAKAMSSEQVVPEEMFGTQKITATVEVKFNLL